MMEKAKTFEKEKNVKGGDYARNTQTKIFTAVSPLFSLFSFSFLGRGETKQKKKIKKDPRTPLERPQGGRGWGERMSLDEWGGFTASHSLGLGLRGEGILKKNFLAPS
jgi:hypothetical protein